MKKEDIIQVNENLQVVIDRKKDVSIGTLVIDLHTKEIYFSKGKFKQSPDNTLVFAVIQLNFASAKEFMSLYESMK